MIAEEPTTGMGRNRSVILHLAILTFTLNVVFAIALQSLPSSTSSLTFNLSLYSVCGAVLSLLGGIGVLKSSPTLLHIFSNHLLLEALISTLPRLLLLPVFFTLPTTFCSFFDPRHPILQQPGAQQPQQSPGGASTDAVIERCRALTWLGLVIGGVVMITTTIMQWMCAWRVREYANQLERRQKQQQEMAACSLHSVVRSRASSLKKEKVEDDVQVGSSSRDVEKGI